MKNPLLSLFACCLFGVCQAQSFDDLLLKKQYVDCRDVSYNAPALIRGLYQRNQTDSLYSFLYYWKEKCGELSHIHSIEMLLDIHTANFDSATIDDPLFASLLAYKENNLLPEFGHLNYNHEFVQLQKNLAKETRAIAAGIRQTYSADEGLLHDFYAADSVSFEKIKTASAADSKLKRIYDRKVYEAQRLPENHIAVFTGYYQPFGKLAVFGPHLSVGALGGVRIFRHTFDLVFDVRFGPSKNEYTFMYKGNLLKDDKWTSVYLGGEYTYDFIITNNVRLGISPGVAYNGITAVTADDDNDNEAKILPALDLSGGLSFKYTFGKRGGYVGLQTRYHWVDHRNPGGTELTGGYLSMRLVIGSIFGYERHYRLGLLDY
ncbi:MAG TPA: hypothetical protein VFM90_00885 [Cyclobacteriaceae bacterium]|nr:hypothetical protein [Cyclobacteriaceae bacterium]